MHPILMRWGTHSLYSYTALMCAGTLLALAYVLRHGAKRPGLAGAVDWTVLDAALWTLAGGFVGARVDYLIGNWQDYAGQPAELWRNWGGGLVFQGGLLAGVLVLWLYSRVARLPFARLLDAAAPALALAQSVGWVGALLHGANYGVAMRSVFSLWLLDLYGVYAPRLPTQLLSAMLGIGLFWALHKLSRFRLVPGTLGLIYLFGNGLGHFILEFARADEAALLGPLRVTQWAELGEAMVASIVMLSIWRGVRTSRVRNHRSRAPKESKAA